MNSCNTSKQVDKFVCPECAKCFTRNFTLKKHIGKSHPNKLEDLVTPRHYKFPCEQCHRRYNSKTNLKSHEKKMHGINKLKKLHKCAVCSDKYERNCMNEHLETAHKISLKTESLKFDSFQDFCLWKSKMEKETKSFFVNKHVNNNADVSHHYFVCHRSGNFVSRSKGERVLKRQGTKKINAFCPAVIKLRALKEKECHVTYQSQHVGHENDLCHLPLSKEDKESLACKLASNLPLEAIIHDVRNNVSTDEMQRINLLTKKDLRNIKSTFGIGSEFIKHKNDAISVEVDNDGEHLVPMKEKENTDNASNIEERKKSLIDKFRKYILSATHEQLCFLEAEERSLSQSC